MRRMIDMASSGANDGVEQKGGIIDDSLGIGYESRICKLLRKSSRALLALTNSCLAAYASPYKQFVPYRGTGSEPVNE